ncbi:class I SAM-dependent methyltransferase [Pedobacter sp. MW01-1-1]|uniref:class I SAM-dependent methyltransferase n=1 Tax=Pedobacter sp. MW01-1-1 TaxID=3383027 RepID=UPI003FF0165E
MENQSPIEQLKEMAKQLSCPEGENGIITANFMHQTNIGMTKNAFNALEIADNDSVLEIGPGNAAHLQEVLKIASNMKYTAIDISATMIEEAKRINAEWIASGNARFILSDGKTFPFADEEFDKITTVNTLYFWKNPLQYLQEIRNILKEKGIFSLCFADKAFMLSLPFTQFTFALYEVDEVKMLLKEAGFAVQNVNTYTEEVRSKAGDNVNREYYVIRAIA